MYTKICVFKDNINNNWYIQNNDNFMVYPFGSFAISFLNTFHNLNNKDNFIKNELYEINNNDYYKKICYNTNNDLELINIYFDLWQYAYNTYLNDYNELMDIILNKDNYNDLELQEAYNKHKYLNSRFIAAINDIDDLNIDIVNNSINFVGFKILTINNKNVACEQFNVKGIQNLFIADLWQLLFNPCIEKLLICNNCGCLLASNNNKSKYCNICKDNYNEIRSNKRKSNKCRYLHKKICDKLKYKKIDTAAFRLESNYYWDIVCNKNIAINDIYDNSIKTENDYYNWLSDMFNSI